jgi:hypothetical protein
VRYLSIFFEIKDSDRTNAVSDGVQPTWLPPQKKQEMKVRSQTFGFLTGTESFLTESLILAQNERWRRG